MAGGKTPGQEAEVQVNDDLDATPRGSAAPPRISPLAVAGLRLAARPDADGIAGLVLDALVPAFADAAAVYGAEQLLRGGAPSPDDGGRVAVRRLGIRCGRAAPPEEIFPGIFPDGEVVVLDPGTPAGQCMRSGEPVAFTWPGSRLSGRVRPAARAALSRFESFLAVPMITDGATAGFVALALRPGRTRVGDGETAAIGILAAHAGTGIAASVAMARHRVLADSLQRGLVSVEPARPRGLEVAGRCLPV
ncbi:MAG: GAF domain-containing protein, partial [Nocardiopsaceae bacterium]|nr:GAF domain-containing protein [Nocardiopsaceae bacterium]